MSDQDVAIDFTPADLKLEAEYVPVTDVGILKDRLSVEKKGRDAGVAKLPAKTDEDLDATHLEIVSWATNELKTLDQNTRSRLQQLDNVRDDVAQAIDDDKNLDSVIDDANRNMGTLWSRNRENLKKAFLAQRDARERYNTFVYDNHIHQREASYPKDHTGSIIFLIFLLTLEAGINTSLFSKGSEFGLAGGFLEALTVAAGNIVLSFFSGRLSRYIVHVKRGFKIIGGMTATSWLVVITLFNLAAAHYRALLETIPEKAFTLVIEKLLSAPHQIDSVHSIWLLLIGMMFAALALWKGLKYDDIYPGYGEKDRALKQAEAHYQAIIEDLNDHTMALAEDAQERVDQKLAAMQLKVKIFGQSIGRTRTVYRNYLEELKSIEKAFHALIAGYRNANIKYRQTEAPPRYFDDPVDLQHDPIAEPSLDAAEAEKEELEKSLEEATNEKHDVKARIEDMEQTGVEGLQKRIREIEEEVARESARPGLAATASTEADAQETDVSDTDPTDEQTLDDAGDDSTSDDVDTPRQRRRRAKAD